MRKDILYETLSLIKKYLFSDKYKAINESSNVEQYNIRYRLHLANRCLDVNDFACLPDESLHSHLKLIDDWTQFNANFQGSVTPELKQKYAELIKETLEFLTYIISLPKETSLVRPKVSQTTDVDDENTKMREIMQRRQALKAEIERQRQKNSKDTAIIQGLEDELEKLTNDFNVIQGTMSKAKSDTIIEQNISKKISESFNELKEYASVIEDERDKMKFEYKLFLRLIPGFIVLFGFLYVFFLYDYRTNPQDFGKWFSFMPYSVMIPVFVALMWLSVYMKDRANKISIELSTRLFNIHYLEGLMKLTNSVSLSHEESLKKLEKAADSLMESYLLQVKHNHIGEKDVSKIEQKELDDNPYWKILQKVESVIKLIKNDTGKV